MSDKGDERVQARVSAERKREWIEAVNSSSEYNNLSHLIIRSVERELSGDFGSGVGEVDVGSVDVDLSPIMEQLRDIRDDVGDVKRQIGKVEASAADSSDILDLAQEILGMIPSGDLNNEQLKERAIEVDDGVGFDRGEDVLLEDIGEYGNVEDIVEYYVEHENMDESVVRLAISKLETDMSRVERRGESVVREV